MFREMTKKKQVYGGSEGLEAGRDQKEGFVENVWNVAQGETLFFCKYVVGA